MGLRRSDAFGDRETRFEDGVTFPGGHCDRATSGFDPVTQVCLSTGFSAEAAANTQPEEGEGTLR